MLLIYLNVDKCNSLFYCKAAWLFENGFVICIFVIAGAIIQCRSVEYFRPCVRYLDHCLSIVVGV